MPLLSLDCPNCGAPLPAAGDRPVVVCAHCGSSIRLPSAEPPPPPPTPTVGDYGRPPAARPKRSALASVTLGPSDVAEVVRLLRDRQHVTAIQFYHAKVGGSLGEAKDAIDAIEAGLKDASAPLPPPSASPQPPDLAEVRELLSTGRRLEAIQRYRQITGAGLQESATVIEGLERQAGRAPVARAGRGARSCATIVGVFAVFFLCIAGGCGAYLQTKPIYRCSISLVEADVVRQRLIAAPVQAGYLVFSPGFQESSGFDSWQLSAEYFTPVWGADGWGVAYVAVSSSSFGSDSVSAKLYTPEGTFRLRDWGPVDCPTDA